MMHITALLAKWNDQTKMAQGKLQEWAIKIVKELVDAEAKAMSVKETGFHLGKEDQTWEFIQSFSVPYGSQARALQHLCA